jgi:hypothetical protein
MEQICVFEAKFRLIFRAVGGNEDGFFIRSFHLKERDITRNSIIVD